MRTFPVLQSPALTAFALLASFALCAPALSYGLLADDFLLRLILSGSRAMSAFQQPWWAAFAFFTPHNHAELLHEGVLPWWADPALRLAFFRPLAALTHLIDMRLWPDTPWLMHLHNLLWSMLALLAAHGLFRRIFELTSGPDARGRAEASAKLALLFYALEPTRAFAVTWIANRNALIAICLSLSAVSLHLDGLRTERRLQRYLSPGVFGLALFASEGAVSALALLISAGLFVDPRGPGRGLRAIAPHAIVALVLAGLATALGYGVYGSGDYLDPRGQPLAYLGALPGRTLALLTAAVGGPAADATHLYDVVVPGLAGMVAAVSCVLIGLLTLWLWPLCRDSRSARFFGLSALLALPPVAAAPVADRLLGWVSIGVVGVFAQCTMQVFEQRPGKRWQRNLASGLLVQRLLISPVLLGMQVQNVPSFNRLLEQPEAVIPRTPRVSQQRAVFVNAPPDPLVMFVPIQRAALGEPRPESVLRLSGGVARVAITRVGARRVELVQDGGFLAHPSERLARSPSLRPFAVGDRVQLAGMQAEVLAITDDARPLRVAFTLPTDQAAGRYQFYARSSRGYAPFELPALGQCVELPALDLIGAMFGVDSPIHRWVNQLTPRVAEPAGLCG